MLTFLGGGEVLERSVGGGESGTHAVTAGINLWNSNEIVIRELKYRVVSDIEEQTQKTAKKRT